MWRRPREPPLHLVDRCLPSRHRTRPGGGPKDPGSCSRCIAMDPQRSQRDAGLPVRSTARGIGCEGVDAELPPLGVWAEGVVAQGSSHSGDPGGVRPVSADTAVARVGRRDRVTGPALLVYSCCGVRVYGRDRVSAEIRRPRLRSVWAGVGSAVLETSSRVVPSVRRFWRTPRSGCTRTRAERA